MKTLLEQAKEIKIRTRTYKKIEDEEIELALAWMKDEITIKQLNGVSLKLKSSGNALYRVAIVLKEAYRKGKLVIKK